MPKNNVEEEFKNGKDITVSFVKGSDGMSFQIAGKSFGTRVAGPKAWGNPYNKSFVEMTFSVQQLFDDILSDWPELKEKIQQKTRLETVEQIKEKVNNIFIYGTHYPTGQCYHCGENDVKGIVLLYLNKLGKEKDDRI